MTTINETVSHFVPTFEKVEPLSYINNIPYTPDGASPGLSFSLVLSQPETQQTAPSHKMQKKLNYETGVTANKRILRTLSKTFRNKQTNSKQQKQLNNKPTLTHTVSQHEINPVTNYNLKATTLLKPTNIAALRAADRSDSPKAVRKNSLAQVRTIERQSSTSNLRNSTQRKNSVVNVAVRNLERQGSASNLRNSVNLKSSLRYNLAKSTVEPVDPAVSPKSPGPKLSPLKSSSPKVASPIAAAPKFQRQASSSSLTSSGFMKPTASSSLKASNNLKSSSTLKQSSPLSRSSAHVARTIPRGANETIDVMLSDFEARNKRAARISVVEFDILQQELAKFEQIEQRKKQTDAAAVTLANNISDCESRLADLFAELDQQQKFCGATEEELVAVAKEFEAELVKKDAERTGVTSAVARMQQAAGRRVLREQWKTEDPRFRLLQAQEDMQSTQAKISALKKELGRLKNTAGKAKSSSSRLIEEQRLRENMRVTGQVRERGQYVRPKGVPKNNEKKAFVSRLEEEKAKRAATKKAVVQHSSSVYAKQAAATRLRTAASPMRR